MTRIIATSDIHGHLPEISQCDILLIAGDICPATDHSDKAQHSFIFDVFYKWIQEVPAKHVVFIAGNHDFYFQNHPEYAASSSTLRTGGRPFVKWVYLEDSAVEIDGLKIYGTPWQPVFCDWAFNLPEHELRHKFGKIPSDTDILISHCPPRGCRDRTSGGKLAGSFSLLDAVEIVKPRLHVFGHIHEAYGRLPIERTNGELATLANVSHCDLAYRPVNPPMEFELTK